MKYAIVLSIIKFPDWTEDGRLGVVDQIVNQLKPIPIESADHERIVRLENSGPGKMVVVADRETLLNNPFDLCDEDFDGFEVQENYTP